MPCITARARKDTQKIDHTVKERAARLNHFARVCICKILNYSFFFGILSPVLHLCK